MFTPDLYVAALHFAAERHAHQKVPDSELPYIVHVTSVAAEVIAALGARPVASADLAVTCALLHDTLEDTPTSYAEVERRFGRAVADGVQALSKDAALPKPERLADSLRRIRAQPHEIWVVKLADRIVNLQPPPASWSVEKRAMYRADAQIIADALGAASPQLDLRIREKIAAYPG